MGRGSKHNLHPDFIRNPAPMLEARQGAAYTGENMTSPESPAILYEHADGRRAVVSANRLATFAIDNPDWHRAGPVEIVWVDDPIRWPKNAKEVREFFNSDFIAVQFAAEDHEPCDEDRYLISAHDFLSAVNWWADFPHIPPYPSSADEGGSNEH